MVYFSSFTDVETRARPEVSAVRVTGLWVFSQKSDAGLGEAGLPWSAPLPLFLPLVPASAHWERSYSAVHPMLGISICFWKLSVLFSMRPEGKMQCLQ